MEHSTCEDHLKMDLMEESLRCFVDVIMNMRYGELVID